MKRTKKGKKQNRFFLMLFLVFTILFHAGQSPIYGEETGEEYTLVEEADWKMVGESDEEDAEEKSLSGNEIAEEFQPDWKNMSDDEITKAVQQAEVEECAKWLAAMHYTDFEKLIKRNTWLTKECTTTEYECENYDEETGEALLVKQGSRTRKYYEFLLESCGLAVPSKYAMDKVSYFANSSGYFYAYFKQNGIQTASATVTIKGIDTSKPINGGSASTSQQRALSLSVTMTGYYPAGFNGTFGTTSATHPDTSTGSYASIWLPFNYDKGAGYCVNIETSGKYGSVGDLFVEENGAVSGGDGNFAQSSNHSTTMKVHIGYNAGVGTSASKNTGHAAFVFNVIPASYSVSYQGNGATGGTTQTQTCVYGNQYKYQKNGFTRQYSLTYQPMGGTVSRSADVVNYSFKGWGSNTTSAGFQEAGSFSNLTAVNGGGVTRYAIWNPSGVKLPSAVRTGYDFLYWKSAQGNKQANSAYTPTKSETMSAVWQAYPYEIAFYSAKEDKTPVFKQQMVYDTEKKLEPVSDMGLDKAGYNFMEWECAKGKFADGMTVKNMTDKKNDTVNLYAVWEARKDTPYIVKYYVQKERGKDSFELYQMEEKTGTTDAVVTEIPAQLEGYVTPQPKQLTILGDGSAEVEFYYQFQDTPTAGEQGKGQNAGSNTTINIYGTTDPGYNNYGLTLKEIRELLKQLQKGSITKLTIDGVEYAIVRNQDGTLEIKVVDTRGQEIVTVPSVITLADQSFSVSGIADGAFRGNDTVRQIYLSGGILTIGDYAFYQCSNLVKVELPDTVMRIGKYAFAKCGKLSDFRFSTGCYEIGEGCFQEDISMKKISLAGKLTKISSKCFYKCKELKTVTIGRQVVSVGKSAFEGCKKMSSVKIPAGVQKIEKRAFYQCKNLKKVTIKSKTLTKVGSKAFKMCKENLKFVVPESKKENYSKLLLGKY